MTAVVTHAKHELTIEGGNLCRFSKKTQQSFFVTPPPITFDAEILVKKVRYSWVVTAIL